VYNVCKYFNRKIKDNEELEAATKLAQKEEMERLQRLQEIQEQVWQQAALDLRLYKQKEVTLPSNVKLEPPSVKLEPAVKSEPLVISVTASQPASLPVSSSVTGAQGFVSCRIVKYVTILGENCNVHMQCMLLT